MKRKQRFLFPLLMAMVMMAMSPQKVWAGACGYTPGCAAIEAMTIHKNGTNNNYNNSDKNNDVVASLKFNYWLDIFNYDGDNGWWKDDLTMKIDDKELTFYSDYACTTKVSTTVNNGINYSKVFQGFWGVFNDSNEDHSIGQKKSGSGGKAYFMTDSGLKGYINIYNYYAASNKWTTMKVEVFIYDLYGHKVSVCGTYQRAGRDDIAYNYVFHLGGCPRPKNITTDRNTTTKQVTVSWEKETYTPALTAEQEKEIGVTRVAAYDAIDNGNWGVHRDTQSTYRADVSPWIKTVDNTITSVADDGTNSDIATCTSGSEPTYYYFVTYEPKATYNSDGSDLTAKETHLRGVHGSTSITMSHVYDNGLCHQNTSQTHLEPCSGKGTEASPYLIDNAGKLLAFRDIANSSNQGAYATLTADINLSGINWNNSIGEGSSGYGGVFNGNGHSIKNMNQGTGGTSGKARALFCSLTGKVTGVTLVAPDVYHNDGYQGCLVRRNWATIENCLVVDGKIQAGNASYLAGFCGVNEASGVIRNCGIVNTTVQRTGVSGYHANAFVDTNCSGGIIENCYAKGANFTNTSNSWFVAFNRSGATLSNCYFSWGASVSGTKHTGCIIVNADGEKEAPGLHLIETSQFTDGYATFMLNSEKVDGTQAWYQNLSGTSTDAYPVPNNTHSTVYYGLDGNANVKYTNSNYSTDYTLSIATAQQLNNLAQAYVKGYTGTVSATLTADIDYTGYTEVTDQIGVNYLVPFRGTFNGNGHKVKVAFVNEKSSEGYQALFRVINGATIQKLHTWGTVTTNSKYGAGVVAWVHTNASKLENVTSSVEIVSSVSGDGTHGGLVGVSAVGTTFTNCAFTGKFTGTETTCWGGMTGWASTGDLYKGNIVILDASSSYGTKGSCTFARGKIANGGERNYYLTAIGTGQGEPKTADQFKSGEVCYLLNGSTNGGTSWYQNLASGGDAYPVLTANNSYKVYKYTHTYCSSTQETCYTNSSTQKDVTDTHNMSIETGLCSVCSKDFRVKTSYRKPTYNTDGVAKSGIKSWETVSDVVAIPLPSSTTRQTWYGYGQTYVVQNGQTVNLTAGAICSGAVNLILEDGATLNVGSDATNNAAINVAGTNSLTIYGQQNNSGKLVAHTNTKYGSAIGGNYKQDGSNITINGGDITAWAYFAAGIGGGNSAAGHDIIINGGTIQAQDKYNGSGSSGIGGGYNNDGYDIFINGGTITATGASNAAGIGGGKIGHCYNISITGGTITATCGSYAAGIGGGYQSYGYNISITGGTITATGKDGADGIGHGFGGGKPDNYKNFTFGPKMGIMTGSTVITNNGGDMYASIHGKSSISVHEHNFTYNKDAGCTTAGTMTTSCSTCNLSNITIADPEHPAIGHKYEAHTLSTSADAAGLYSYVCDNGCGQADPDKTNTKTIKDYAPNATGTAKNLELTVADGNYSTTEALTLTDANQFVGISIAFTTPQAPTYSRTMTSEWGTLIVLFALSAAPEGFEFYSIRNLIGGNTLCLDKITGSIEAGTPVFVRRTGEGTSLSLTASSETVNTAITTASGTALQGTYSSVNLTKAANPNDYFLYSNQLYSTSKLGNENYATIRPFRAYLTTSAASESKLQIMVEEETTSLTPTLSQGEGAMSIYNLNGQKLAAPHKGINIINGKKVLVK